MKTTANGLKWSALERLGVQAIQLVVMLFLARILGPDAFGLIGILTVFIAISQVISDSGFSSALIRFKERTEIDFSTAFQFNILVAVLCYLVLFLSARQMAAFFEQPELEALIKVLGLSIIINSFTLVQKAKLTINMDFKTQAKASLSAVFISSFISITLAYLGYGVWALVYQILINSFLTMVLLNVFHPWVPKSLFNKKSFHYLFGFGYKLLLAALLDTLFKNIYQVIIGKQFNPTQVGIFTQANQLASVPAMTFTTIVQRVTYPMLSNIQSETNKFEHSYKLTLRLSAFVIFPLMIGLAIIAQPFVAVILGDEWLEAADLLSILCCAFMLYPIHAINLNLLQVKGRSDIFLKLEVIKKALIVLMLFITIPLGIKAICIGMLIHTYIAFFINSYYTGQFSKLKTRDQLSALAPIWLMVLLSALLTYLLVTGAVTVFLLNSYIQLFLSIVIMPAIYIALARIFQRDLYIQTLNIILRRKV
ncbi:lipopolysaccharide biosynthesis protein [Pseudoalteromonas sp. bablab_jr011]|jgi:O-antigen/teichoic acid export membrane protein|uniref:lipopolysaccharide biosynthesis protein n=1 Tax=Pseudoalteromonas sp. bablab_jr011 TaxID=2755062 RepID=UPI0018F76ED5|nr:lipopolysaccharide biosynthesis protein [Pseudoalteromonas sp. bablab_jr011]